MEKSETSNIPHILLLGGDGGYSGVPTYLEQLCAALKSDARFTIVADRNEGGYDFARGAITLREIQGMKTGLSLPRLWQAMRALDAEISAIAPDLIWAHARMSLIQLRLLMILRRLRKKPVPRFAVTYHGLPFGPGHRRIFAAISLVIERVFLALTPPHQLHFLSAAAAEHFADRLGARALKRHTCHVLINCSRLGRLGLRTRNAAPTLLMTGRAGYQKNHSATAQIFAALPDNYQLILCGAGTEADRMAPLFEAVKPGLSKQVQFLGPISDVRPYLAQADLFMLPSRYEGMPIAALEAFEAGLPMALSDIPGMAEILERHPMVVAINPKAPEAVVPAVIDLVEKFRSSPDTSKTIQSAWVAHFSYDQWQIAARKLLGDLMAFKR